MGLLNYTTRANLVANTPENIADVTDCLDKIRTSVNSIDAEQFSSSLEAKMGATSAGRGKCIIATSESRSNTAYGTLTTPDQVSNIVLPTDGLMFVAYQATWQESVQAAARAAIFIGSTQLQIAAAGATAPLAIDAAVNNAGGTVVPAARDVPLASGPMGLYSQAGGGSSLGAYGGDVTTGQVIGGGLYANPTLGPGGQPYQYGACCIFAAAGTYTVSVQFKASSGSVTAKNRKLWVWTLGF